MRALQRIELREIDLVTRRSVRTICLQLRGALQQMAEARSRKYGPPVCGGTRPMLWRPFHRDAPENN